MNAESTPFLPATPFRVHLFSAEDPDEALPLARARRRSGPPRLRRRARLSRRGLHPRPDARGRLPGRPRRGRRLDGFDEAYAGYGAEDTDFSDYDKAWHSGPEMQILDNERHPDRAQDHGNKVWFRNLEIRPLGEESGE